MIFFNRRLETLEVTNYGQPNIFMAIEVEQELKGNDGFEDFAELVAIYHLTAKLN